MNAKIVLGFVLTMATSLAYTMHNPSEEQIGFVIERVGVEDPLQTTQPLLTGSKPPLSRRGKIVAGFCTAGLCLGTTAAAGLGEYFSIWYVDNNTTLREGGGSIVVGTTVALSICALGLCTYAGGVAFVKWFQGKKAEDDRNDSRV